MGTAYAFEKEKLIFGCLLTEKEIWPTVQEKLESLYGPMDFVSDFYNFSEISPYYDEEMQGVVYRTLFSFQTLIDPSTLADIKRKTNEIEASLSSPAGRNVNLDPGTMGPGKLILATTKPAAHRIALQNGIFAEITLFYARGNFQVLPWTYIDFRSDEVRKILCKIRNVFMRQRRNHEADSH